MHDTNVVLSLDFFPPSSGLQVNSRPPCSEVVARWCWTPLVIGGDFRSSPSLCVIRRTLWVCCLCRCLYLYLYPWLPFPILDNHQAHLHFPPLFQTKIPNPSNPPTHLPPPQKKNFFKCENNIYNTLSFNLIVIQPYNGWRFSLIIPILTFCCSSIFKNRFNQRIWKVITNDEEGAW